MDHLGRNKEEACRPETGLENREGFEDHECTESQAGEEVVTVNNFETRKFHKAEEKEEEGSSYIAIAQQ